MADLKPLGSEKLPLDEKIKRIMEIAQYGTNPSSSSNNKPNETIHYTKQTANCVYGVVREKDGYYVKRGLNESTLDYIGGMQMKNKNRFSSYAEAVKRLELIARPLSEQEKKYVLDNPVAEDPATEPSMDVAPEGGEEVPSPEMPSDDMGDTEMDAAPDAEMPVDGGEETIPGDAPAHMKVIQKLTGKLGQRLRDNADKLQSDDLKYVINSVLSAIDLEKLDENDRDEIASRFEEVDYDNLDTGEFDSVEDDDLSMGDEGDMGDVGGDVPPAPTTDAGGEDEEELGEVDDIFENFQRLDRILRGK